MTIRERLGDTTAEATPVYGEPFETADGATVITVARRGAILGTAVRPVGVFVVRDGAATWVPAVDSTRIALLGGTVGLLAAVIGTLAVLRRPPWPDLRIRLD